jgi:hypothetical protein
MTDTKVNQAPIGQTPAKPDATAVAAVSAATEKTVIQPDTSGYSKARSASGSMSQHNGDIVANSLRGMSVSQVASVAAGLIPDATLEQLLAKYEHLNIGQQRMALGNRIRGAIARINRTNNALVAKTVEGEKPPAVVCGEDRLVTLSKPIRKEVEDSEAKTDAEAKKKAEATKKAAADKAAAAVKVKEAAKANTAKAGEALEPADPAPQAA